MQRLRIQLLTNTVLLLMAILVQISQAQAAEPNRWAILIGVDDYIQAQDLKYCGADQQALKDQLVASGFEAGQVFLLHDKATDRKYQPTKRNIEKQLELVLSLVDRGDVVLLSFSGHGVHFGGKSYLCPNDAELDDPETLIDTQSIYDLLKGSRASLKVLIVDACRNDPRPGGQRAFKATAGSTALARSFQDEKLTPEGVVLLNSCSPGEISWEEEKFGHGVFMNFVLDGLKGQADRNSDGSVSLSELAKYANLNTKLHVARKYNDSQRPFITNESTLDALDFDFTLRIPQVKDLITNSIGMKLKLIPAGEFLMGSGLSAEAIAAKFDTKALYYEDEHPQHRVQITKPFYLGQHEVTVGQFREFVRDSGYETEAETDGEGGYGFNESTGKLDGRDTKYNWKSTGFAQTNSHPVVNVTWNDAVAFCSWLSRKEGMEYRLPTEAEWEYACRAGTRSLYHHGDNPEGLAFVGNVADGTAKAKFDGWPTISAKDGYVVTAPVGQFRANGFGLYGMHGNVWEWCGDRYGRDYYKESPTTDPRGPSSGSFRVTRGGCWSLSPQYARSAFRFGSSPDDRGDYMGFRVLRSSVLSGQ